MKKVYIIDDDRDIVESISIVLKANGYEVMAQYDDKNVSENILKLQSRPDHSGCNISRKQLCRF